MPRRPAPLQVPSLDVLSQRPIPGAPALLGRALSSIPEVLSGRQLDTSGVLLASASSELCPAQLAWNGRPYIGAIDRAELFRMARRCRAACELALSSGARSHQDRSVPRRDGAGT